MNRPIYTFLSLMLIGHAHAADLLIDQSVDQEARTWLVHIEKGQMKKAWEAGNSYFKKVLPLEDWLKGLHAVAALGPVQTRTLTSVTFASKMPGSVDGQYALLHYETSFQHKDRTTETVILKRDDDQAWRGVGYLVK
ncbi:MAG: DUF4019 domain-containing protein [Betaproteobacteria bacterium]|nr:DUF4019 domain-containing protein [Betaproteobacteria bacterium]